jgi:head-tail adaptor
VTLPAHLLRSLTRATRSTTTDSYGATVTNTWSTASITGRVDQQSRSEDLGDGRQAEISEWRLWTDTAVDADDRIVDGSTTFQIVGKPWPVYDDTEIHHYEATLRLVEG